MYDAFDVWMNSDQEKLVIGVKSWRYKKDGVCLARDSNPGPLGSKPSVLTARPSPHLHICWPF